MCDLIRCRFPDGNVQSIPRDELTLIKPVPLPHKPAYFGERDELYRWRDRMYLLVHVRTWQDSLRANSIGVSVDERTHNAKILTPDDAADWLCERGFDDEATAIREAEAEPAGDFRDLAKWTANNLKKTQRAMVETLIDNGGRLPIPDLTTLAKVGDFNRTYQRVNGRLRKVGWHIIRHDNQAHLERLKGRQK